MRILAMTNLYPNPFQPNRAPFNRQRFRLLDETVPVRVIAPIAWTDELRARLRNAAVLPRGREIVLDGLVVDHPRFLFPPRIMRRYLGRFYLNSVRATFRRAMSEFHPDLLYATWAYPDGWAAIQLGRWAGVPVVIQVHGSDVLLLDQFPERRRPTEEALRAANGLVVVSQDLADRLETMGIDPERILVNYDGVDTTLFCPGDKTVVQRRLNVESGEPLLLFIGNLVPVKGVGVLLAAFGALRNEGFAGRLDIVGEGPLREKLRHQVEQLNLQGKVRFLGSLPQEQLPDRYRAADLFVLPSNSEGVPNVLLEASACDVPWVASRVGGIPEIVRMGRGRLVTPNAPHELAAAIREMIANPPKAVDPASRPGDRKASVATLIEYLRSVLSQARDDRATGQLIPSTATCKRNERQPCQL